MEEHMQFNRRAIAPLAFAAAVLASESAMAQAMSDYERAMLAGLTPALRAEVEQRMRTPGQKVSEIIDTILLNKISMLAAQGKIVATDYEKKVVVAQFPTGQMRIFKFNPQTLDVTE
jgi:predicted DNA-binding transcriptional regulator YafY